MRKPAPAALVQLGFENGAPAETLGALLLACHQRIRRYCRLALTVGVRPDLPAAEVKAAAAQCLRYFGEALPMHVQDEEVSLWPRLAGRAPGIDATLAQMRAQHFEHVGRIEALQTALRRVFEKPNEPALHRQLASAASTVETDFDAHLKLEEEGFFPQLNELLSEDEREAIVDELRARRRSTA